MFKSSSPLPSYSINSTSSSIIVSNSSYYRSLPCMAELCDTSMVSPLLLDNCSRTSTMPFMSFRKLVTPSGLNVDRYRNDVNAITAYLGLPVSIVVSNYCFI